MQRERGASSIACLAGIGPLLTVAVRSGGAYGKSRRREGAAVMAQHEGFADAAVAAFVIPAADRARQRRA
jgi:hypothetical protein